VGDARLCGGRRAADMAHRLQHDQVLGSCNDASAAKVSRGDFAEDSRETDPRDASDTSKGAKHILHDLSWFLDPPHAAQLLDFLQYDATAPPASALGREVSASHFSSHARMTLRFALSLLFPRNQRAQV
jgi:hypothetical protein